MQAMNRVFIRLYAFFCSVILLGTLILFAVKIYNNSKENLVAAEKNFKYIARFISANSEKEYIAAQPFLKKIQELCALSGNIDKAMLNDSDNKTIFSWDAKTGDVSTVAYEMPSASFVLKPYSMSITVKNPNNADVRIFNFSAVLKTVSDDVLYNSIRDCVFVFSVLFLCTLLLLIINYLMQGSRSAVETVAISEERPTVSDISTAEIDKLHVDRQNYSLDDLADIDFSKTAPLEPDTFQQSEKIAKPAEYSHENTAAYTEAVLSLIHI